MPYELPYNLVNGEDADAVQVMGNFNYLLSIFVGLAGGFTQVSVLPAEGTIGQTVLLIDATASGTPYYYGRDSAWHALFLAS